jgi:hypothetical protein
MMLPLAASDALITQPASKAEVHCIRVALTLLWQLVKPAAIKSDD